ncbi:MAG: ABC transporter ATP-binding protein [Nitrososphaerota archaeon]
MLEVSGLSVWYGSIQVLWDVSLEVGREEVVGVFGPNGAGKTTLLRTIMGLNKYLKGRIVYDGREISSLPVRDRSLMGISYVPEGKRVFPQMRVVENLMLGATNVSDWTEMRRRLEDVYSYFPWLRERQDQQAGTLSGGEMQMLTIARGLMSNPKLLMLDEPSFGVAPIYVKRIFQILKRLNEERGITVCLVEQKVKEALKLCSRCYIIESGRVVMEGEPASLERNDYVREVYLGI